MPTAFVTAPREGWESLAETLVEERLAACVNAVDCESIYRWDGDVHHDDEVVLLAKTTAAGYEDLAERVVELHPYDVPCIERFDEDDALPAFVTWIDESVGPK